MKCGKTTTNIMLTSLPYFRVKLSCVCLMFAYRKKVMTYSDPMVTYSHHKITYSYPKLPNLMLPKCEVQWPKGNL